VWLWRHLGGINNRVVLGVRYVTFQCSVPRIRPDCTMLVSLSQRKDILEDSLQALTASRVNFNYNKQTKPVLPVSIRIEWI